MGGLWQWNRVKGANALYTVTRTSLVSGNTYTSHACENHVKEWELADNVVDLRKMNNG